MKRMRLAAVLAVAAGAVAAAIPAAASCQRAGRVVGLAVGQPAAAGQHPALDVVRRQRRLRGRRRSARSSTPTDGGSTWSGLLSGTYTDLTEVQAIDANAVFAGGGCVARRSDDGGATFRRVAFTPVESSLPRAAGGGLVRRPRHRLPRAHRRHRPAHRQQRRHVRPEEPAARHARPERQREAVRARLHRREHRRRAPPRTARSTARPTARTRGRWSPTPTAPCARSCSSTPTTASRWATARCS